MLAHDPPLNLNDWLNYTAPYHDPKPRKPEDYYKKLSQPENAALLSALRQKLMPANGGQKIERARLDWLIHAAKTEEKKSSRPARSESLYVRRVYELINNNLLDSRLPDKVWQENQATLQQLLTQLSAADLKMLQKKLAAHCTQHDVSYINDCSNSYTSTTVTRQALIDKNRQITEFLREQTPPAATLDAFLAQLPQPRHYDTGRRLQTELETTEKNSTSVLYRIREVQPLKAEATIDALKKAGINRGDVTEDNFEALLQQQAKTLCQGIMKRPREIKALLKTNLVLKMVQAQTNEVSAGYIQDLTTKYIEHFQHPANRGNQDDVMKYVLSLLKQVIAEHPILTKHYGIESHRLAETNGLYSVGKTGHTLDKNMVWVHANIHAGRQFRINAKLRLSNIMRQTPGQTEDPSAFANEISALISAGYKVVKREEAYYFDPPRVNGLVDTASLGATTINTIQKDMNKISEKLAVLNNVHTALNQQHAIHWKTIEPLSKKYSDAQTLDRINLAIEQKIAPYRTTYAMASADAAPNLAQMITYLEEKMRDPLVNSPDNPFDTYQTDLAQLKEFRTDLAAIPALQDDQDLLDEIRKSQADLTNQAQAFVRAHHQLSDFTDRLELIRQHAQGNNHPPSTEVQLVNAEALYKEVQHIPQTIKAYNLTEIDFPEVETLVQECQQAHQAAFQAHYASQQQSLGAQQAEDEQAPDRENDPTGPAPD